MNNNEKSSKAHDKNNDEELNKCSSEIKISRIHRISPCKLDNSTLFNIEYQSIYYAMKKLKKN